jgi:hypothetical protein
MTRVRPGLACSPGGRRKNGSKKASGNMSILPWILLGLVAGFVGSKLVNKTGEGVLPDIIFGVVGAVVGGYVFSMLAHTG